MPESEATKRFRERHKQLGLCVLCSRKPKSGSVHCEVCLRRSRERWKAHHPLFCGECEKLIKPEERRNGNRFHKRCAEKRRATKYPQQHRLASLAYQRRHRELGLCHSCSEKTFKWGCCQKHYRMAQERYYERAAG